MLHSMLAGTHRALWRRQPTLREVSIQRFPQASPRQTRKPSPWRNRLPAELYGAVTDSVAPGRATSGIVRSRYVLRRLKTGRASSGIISPRCVLLVTALGDSCCCSSLKQQLRRFEEVQRLPSVPRQICSHGGCHHCCHQRPSSSNLLFRCGRQ